MDLDLDMSRGFLTMAQNSVTGDYVACAEALALSLRWTQLGPHKLSILVPQGQVIPGAHPFDQIIEFDPYGTDPGKWNAHTKVLALQHTPYDETILLDADMIFPSDISWWWDILGQWETLFCTQVKTYRGDPVDEENNPYREEFRKNNLPNIYTALMYFRNTAATSLLFTQANIITEGWEWYSKHRLPERVTRDATDDMSFACALMERNLEHEMTSKVDFGFSFTHMKTGIQGFKDGKMMREDWTRLLNSYIRNDAALTVGNYRQFLPFHYHDRSFLTNDMLTVLRS